MRRFPHSSDSAGYLQQKVRCDVWREVDPELTENLSHAERREDTFPRRVVEMQRPQELEIGLRADCGVAPHLAHGTHEGLSHRLGHRKRSRTCRSEEASCGCSVGCFGALTHRRGI